MHSIDCFSVDITYEINFNSNFILENVNEIAILEISRLSCMNFN